MDKTQEQLYDDKFLGNDPQKTEYTKNTYSFTSEEISKIQSLDTIAQMGQMAQMMLDTFIQADPLARLSLKNSKDTAILYDLPKKQFIVYNPKIWCSVCDQRKGSLMYMERILCNPCYDQMKQKEEVIEHQHTDEQVVSEPKEVKKKKK